MEDREDNHHEPHRFLQEAHPRQGRLVSGHGPEDFPEQVWWFLLLPAGHLTRSDQKLIGHWAHREPAPHGEPAV
jgi:hypothetical protein